MAGDSHPSSTHPPLPPTTEDIRFWHLRLLRSRRVGPSTYHRLLTEHGSAQNALAALPNVARAAGVSGYQIAAADLITRELTAGARLGAKMLLYGHEGYPRAFMDFDTPPPLFWALGNTSLLTRPNISLVGARNASSLGMRMAKHLAKELGEAGLVVTSGLARGIDAAAHNATLETGTIAVQAGGLDILYPAENAELAREIGEKGLRISEQPFGLQPQARHFPVRNRLIAGLSQGCVVIEAAAKSGSLITARDAADLGRDVFAVPGHPFDARAAGCNHLIRDGAILVRGARDILESLAPLSRPHQPVKPLPAPASAPQQATRPANANFRDLHRQILDKLGPTPIAEDQLIRDLAATAATIAPILTELELIGQITRHPGGLLSKSH